MLKNERDLNKHSFDIIQKGEVIIPPKKSEAKELVDTLDSEDQKKTKVDKLSPKGFDILAGLVAGHLFGIVDADEGNADAKKNAERYLGENVTRKIVKGLTEDDLIELTKAVDLASFAPVGEGCKRKNVVTNTWEDCDKDAEAPKKKLKIYDVGRYKNKKTSGRVRGANQGKRGEKVKV